MPDARVDRLGTVVLLQPLTPEAEAWLVQNAEAPAWAWQGGALAVEPRMIDALVDGMTAAGLEVET